LLIAASRVVPGLPGTGVLEPGYLMVHRGRITEVGEGAPPSPPDLVLGTGALVPGLVDLQVNGYYGVDLADCDADGWAMVARRLPETGTTAFLPTFITAPVATLATALRSAAKVTEAVTAGARVLGVHLEGPFLSPARAGAHRRDWIVPPSPGAVAELLDAGRGMLRLVTLAPEVDGGLATVAALAAAEIVVSLGHSDATAAEVAAGAAAGARMVTHLFNAQRGLHHREPGVVGQALTDQRLTSGLIVDLCHVSAAACVIAFAAAPGRICLVTDAAACAVCRRGIICSAASRRYSRRAGPRRSGPTGRWPVPRFGWTGPWPTPSRWAWGSPRRWPRPPGSRQTSSAARTWDGWPPARPRT
jgi:N-acetylglucosamine-6-phosphate deacetylase